MHTHGLRDWALLAALVAMWGSAFMFNKLAVASVPPATVAAGRLAVGAFILLAVVFMRGLRLPPPGRAWLPYVVLALVGNCVPFYVIVWWQQVIDSALAGTTSFAAPLIDHEKVSATAGSAPWKYSSRSTYSPASR